MCKAEYFAFRSADSDSRNLQAVDFAGKTAAAVHNVVEDTVAVKALNFESVVPDLSVWSFSQQPPAFEIHPSSRRKDAALYIQKDRETVAAAALLAAAET